MHHEDHSSAPSIQAIEAIDSIESLTGVHPGHRRVHAKGACYQAVFTANGHAAPLTTAAHLQRGEVEAVVRFSDSTSDPALADVLSPGKGISVQFRLPDGAVTNLIAITLPVFFARTPESFIDIVKAVRDTKNGEITKFKMLEEIIEHFSESKNSFLALRHLKPPLSYATNTYFAVHAYYFVDRSGNRRPIKYEWLPDLGVQTLSVKEAEDSAPDYLKDELNDRLAASSVGFQLVAVLGEEGDPTDDPTQFWPKDRERIVIGHLVINKPVPEPEGLLMDPTVMIPGLALSDDPILRFRHEAYAESYNRRSHNR